MARKWACILTAAVMVVSVAPVAWGAQPTPAERLRLTQVVAGLSGPVDLRAPAGDSRQFVVELPGRIRIIENGALRSQPFLNITGRVSTGGERGLFSMAFHPNYEKNRKFYVYYTNNNGDVRISEFKTKTSDPNKAKVASERILLTIPQFASNHNGGGLTFGSDGYLYIAVGDGGGGGDPGENGQNPNTLLGSLLRIDVRTKADGNQYAIPATNPFVGGGGAPEVYAYGLRNPWRMSADLHTGLLYIGDVGQNRREEVNVLSVGEGAAVNFGWDVMEGSLCYEPAQGCDTTGKRLPVVQYVNPDQGVSVIGGYVYRGSRIPWLRGTYFYSDLAGRRLRSFRYENGKAKEKTDWTSQVGLIPGSVFGFGQDGLGEIYVLAGGAVYRIDPAQPAVCDFNGDGDDDLAVGIPGEDINGDSDAGAVQVFPSVGMPQTSGDVLWHQDSGGVPSATRPDEQFGSALACGDFNGDSFDDLAIGAPGDQIGGGPAAGSVVTLMGSPGGLTATGQYLVGAVAGEEFGASLTAGDFDGDGYTDLAVGLPGDEVSGEAGAGSVAVFFGTNGGLEANPSISLSQDTPQVKGNAAAGDRFGAALAALDFDGDGYTDLAVGVPNEDVTGAIDAGAAHVFFGHRNKGLTTAGDLKITQPGVGGPEGGDLFGSALAGGPLDQDGTDDLVIGAPGEMIGGMSDAGAVSVIRGSASRQDDAGHANLRQGLGIVGNQAEQDDGFGSSVAVGDANGDWLHDLAVGVPGEMLSGVSMVGAVQVVYGASDLDLVSSELWHQGTPGVPGNGTDSDLFGSSVAFLDSDRDGLAELAIGAPGERVGGAAGAGQVTILDGRASGVGTQGAVRLNQGSVGAAGNPTSGDSFGSAIIG